MIARAYSSRGLLSLETVYLTKIVSVGTIGPDATPVIEAYNRHYCYLGQLSLRQFAALSESGKIVESWADYDGGHGSPRDGAKGLAHWWEARQPDKVLLPRLAI